MDLPQFPTSGPSATDDENFPQLSFQYGNEPHYQLSDPSLYPSATDMQPYPGGVDLTDGNQHDYSTGSINAPVYQGVNGFYYENGSCYPVHSDTTISGWPVPEQFPTSITGQSVTQSDFNQLSGPNEPLNSVGLDLPNQYIDRETNQHSPAIYEDYSGHRALEGMSEQRGTQLQQDNSCIQRVRESQPVPIENEVTPPSESSSKLRCHHPNCNHDYVYAYSQGLRDHERIKHNSPKRGPGRKRTRSAA